MNRLSIKDRAQIIGLLVEGNSLRSTTRIPGKSINTVTKLLIDVGTGCSIYQNESLRNLPCKQIQCDEIWSFCSMKERNVAPENKGDWVSAQLVKIYGAVPTNDERRYSPAGFLGSEKTLVSGKPDIKKVSTSLVERQNLTMRVSMRRFTRLTNGFSKKIHNHECAVALHFMHYNFGRIHKALRVTPAMEAGISDHVWSLEEIAELAD